jgi:hypothetical protein
MIGFIAYMFIVFVLIKGFLSLLETKEKKPKLKKVFRRDLKGGV